MRVHRGTKIPGWIVAVCLATLTLILVTADQPADAATADPDLALFDPASGQWHLRYGNGTVDSFYYGIPGDTPVMGDWDCNGIDTVAMYRESAGFMYLRNTNDFGVAGTSYFFGAPGDLPIAGDWNGDGCDTVSIYRPSEGKVYVINNLGTAFAEFSYYFGQPGDRPFAGDFDDDGTDTVGLYRQSSGFVYFTNATPGDNGVAPTDNSFFYGNPGDRILAGDWDGDGDDSVGIYRPSGHTFYLSLENQLGNADIVLDFGEGTWLPTAGEFGPPPPCGEFASFALTGTGDDVVSVGASAPNPALLDISYGGASNFVVWSQDSGFSTVDLLVNEIGRYEGTRPINHTSSADGVEWLEITASGPWTIQVRPFCEMRILTGDLIAGTGDDVVRVNRSGAAALTHDGSSNFVVRSYDETDWLDTEVNEIGTYTGIVLIDFGTDILEVEADGNWSVTFQDPRVMVGNSIFGTGDEVVTVSRSGPATLTHDGSSNFVVWSYDGTDRLDLEVNEIGAYVGTVTIDSGTEFLEITADGNWSVTFQ